MPALFAHRAHILLFAPALLAITAFGAPPDIAAPAPLDDLLRRYLEAPGAESGRAAIEAARRDIQRTATQLLATEGYFSPRVRVENSAGRLFVTVTPGPRTIISEVTVDIHGELSSGRRNQLVAAWPLTLGKPFRDADWNEAKQTVLRRLLALDFPAARLTESRAEVDPTTARARLHVVYETGPLFVFGDLLIEGLARYPPELIRRYNDIKPGTHYDESELLALQGALQRTPYFASVSVDIVRPEPLPSAGPVRAPVVVHVSELAPHRLSLGVGASSNTGAQAEAIYRGLDFLHRAWQLDAGLRLEQLRQSLYADVHLPPQDNRYYGFGALAENEDIQGLRRRRFALGADRTQRRGTVESRYAINWQREIREPADARPTTSRALTADATWTVRRVDAPLDPRRGYVATLQVGGGAKALLSDQNFLRLHLRYEHFLPFAARDALALRGALGTTLAPSRAGIPQDFLFRAGGTQSVRGYAYQSLGVHEGGAVVGGRYLAVIGAEYTHWFKGKWGAAVFVDAGNAGDDRAALKPAVGYGIGARWKSPAGPLAVDLAYGERERKWRLHFSLAIAF